MSSINTVGVVGTGTMGAGIAQTAALSGKNVVAIDVDFAALKRAELAIERSLARLVKKSLLNADDAGSARQRIAYATDYAALAAADVLIEAATEALKLKRSIVSKLSEAAAESALLATNTSSLSITLLSASARNRANFIGLHFFNPVPQMPLVEIVRGMSTSDAACARAEEFVKELGKTPIVVANAPGFVVNRLLVPMINEAFFLLGEGAAPPEQIDQCMQLGANHPIGPLALADLIGLDVCLAIVQTLHADFGDGKYRPAPVLREFVAAGRLGKKSGRGVYPYS